MTAVRFQNSAEWSNSTSETSQTLKGDFFRWVTKYLTWNYSGIFLDFTDTDFWKGKTSTINLSKTLFKLNLKKKMRYTYAHVTQTVPRSGGRKGWRQIPQCSRSVCSANLTPNIWLAILPSSYHIFHWKLLQRICCYINIAPPTETFV